MFTDTGTESNLKAAREQLDELGRYVVEAAREGTEAHVVERHLFRQVLAVGGKLFGWFLKSVGPGDLGETVELPGRTVKRLPEQQERGLTTVFGRFTVSRFVYGTRPGQKIELAPTDQRLGLAEGEASYLLQEWDQMLATEHAFAKVGQTLKAVLGLGQSVDTLERGNRQMAEAAPAFREAQPAPDPKAEGEILVVSEDNKGVPMVRPVAGAGAARPGAHRTKGEKANKKQMACIGCVYTVEPHVRTPEELIAVLFRDPGRKPQDPPQACQKRYWAELTHASAGRVVRGQDRVFEQMARDVALRRRPGQVMVHLCDGQKSLETDRERYLPRDASTVEILELLHVLPRMWEASHLFNAEGSDEAALFVRQRLPLVLSGNAADVIAEFRRLGIERGLRGAEATRLRKLCAFLENNLHRMDYDLYLKAGYPVSSGVIEGACRHVIKDRMERAGMRWKVPGAQAMLQLRAISAGGDWDAFLAFRIERERSRLYPHKDATEKIPWPFAA